MPLYRFSGWKGTVMEIGAKTIEKMQKSFGCRPEDIYGAIAPSICQDCYEVSGDVIEEVRKTFSPEKYRGDYADQLFYQKPDGKYQLNLWRACEHPKLFCIFSMVLAPISITVPFQPE